MRFQRAGDGERTLAVFIDFENLALGFAGKRDRFEIGKVLERLVEKGKIVTKKAYADWSRFGIYAQALHEAAIELIEIPKRSITGKNSADIRLVVDAVDFAYAKDHIDTFVIVSGDSDFSPLVSKLKELGKHVIGLGLVEATSNLLRDNCDEFIYYEDLDRPQSLGFNDAPFMPEAKRKVFGLLLESLMALRRENKETIFSSMAKDTMKRKRPSFNEEYHGYRTFSELLEDAAKSGLIELEKNKGSGTYVIVRFGGEMRGTQLASGQNMPTVLPHPQPMTPPSRVLPQAQVQASLPVAQPEPQRQAVRPATAPAQPSQVFHAPASMRSTVPPATPTPVAETPRPRPTQTPSPLSAAKPTVPPRRPAPPPVEVDEEFDDAPKFGRSLMDELDDDDLDELPSYGTGRNSPPANKPPERKARAAAEQKPAQKPRQSKPTSPPPSPPTAPVRPVSAPPTARQVSSPPPPARQVSPPPPPPPPAPKPKPKPNVVEDEGFGAGLDD